MRKSRLVKKTASKKRFSGKSRLAILATAVAALALAIVSLTAGTEVSAQSAQGKARKFQATRAFVVDKQSGEVRMPTQQEVDRGRPGPDGVRPAAGRERHADDPGERHGRDRLRRRLGGVVLARPNADGTFETRCVFTLEEGAAFLGLVEDSSAQ